MKVKLSVLQVFFDPEDHKELVELLKSYGFELEVSREQFCEGDLFITKEPQTLFDIDSLQDLMDLYEKTEMGVTLTKNNSGEWVVELCAESS